MMRHLVGAACGFILGLSGLTGMAAAQTQPVVVELFTSQGCSSCPPADAFFAALAANPGVIALSLHVDYWDYIGWKDTFADPLFTKRQKAYARAAGSRMIYTPQIIVDGVDRLQGNDPEMVLASIQRHMLGNSPVSLSVTRQGDRILIRAEADPPLTRKARVQVVRYRPEATIEIERGENAGRTVTYHNIVTSWQEIADWAGQAPFEHGADVPGTEPVVVIVQSEGPGEVLASAVLK